MTDVITFVQEEHREVEALFAKYREGRASDVLDQILRNLTRHAGMEEAVLYPEVARAVEGGADLVRHAHSEHGDVRQMILDIRTSEANGEDISPDVEALEKDVQRHVAEEEQDVLPRLQQSIPSERLDAMGAEMERMKSQTPR